MSLFRKKYEPVEQTDSETEAIEKRYDGDLFEKAMEIASAPGNKYLTNIQSGNISKEEFLDLIHDELHAYSTDEEQITDAMRQLTKWIWGYYIIEEFLNDDRISDIKIYNERNIRLKRYGKRIGTDVRFKNKSDYIKFVDKSLYHCKLFCLCIVCNHEISHDCNIVCAFGKAVTLNFTC